MTTVRTFFLIAVAQLSKILLGLVLIKLCAVYLGPDGVGRLGNLMSFVTMLVMLAGGGVSNGVIKYVAQYRNSPRQLLLFLSNAASYSFVISFIIAFILIFFSGEVSEFLFFDRSYFWAVYLLAFLQVCVAFSNLIVGVLNGYRKTMIYSGVQISGNILAMLAAVFVISTYKFKGGIIAIATSYAYLALPAVIIFYRSSFCRHIRIGWKFLKGSKKLFTYSLMVLASAIVVPMTEIFIRQLILDDMSFEELGIWQALIKISSVYIGFFALFLAYDLVPKLSPINNRKIISMLIAKYALLVGCVFFVVAFIALCFSRELIQILLSDSFMSLEPLLPIQLLGDLFRVLSFVIGFVTVAKAYGRTYIVGEMIQYAIYALCVYFFLRMKPELSSVVSAYAVSSLIYLLLSMLLFLLYKNNHFIRG